jgi:hypothetical protein
LLEREAVLKFTVSCPRDELEAWAERHVQLAKAVENGLDQPDLAPRHAEVDGGFHHELTARCATRSSKRSTVGQWNASFSFASTRPASSRRSSLG